MIIYCGTLKAEIKHSITKNVQLLMHHSTIVEQKIIWPEPAICLTLYLLAAKLYQLALIGNLD